MLIGVGVLGREGGCSTGRGGVAKRLAVPDVVRLHSKVPSVETIVTEFSAMWTVDVGMLMSVGSSCLDSALVSTASLVATTCSVLLSISSLVECGISLLVSSCSMVAATPPLA